MDIEFYDEEKHSYFLDEYREYSREPDSAEKEFFRSELEEVVQEVSQITGISPDFKLYFAMTDESVLEEDAPINRYVHGFSFAGWMEGFDRDVIMIRAVKDRENWKNCLVNMLAHEMAHQEFYSKNQNLPYTNLENIVFEGHAMNRAEEVARELDVDWKPHYRSESQIDIEAEEILEVLDEDRSYEPDNIFKNGEEPCKEAEGYNIAYQVVKNIVERTELELSDIPQTSDERMRGEVEESLENTLT